MAGFVLGLTFAYISYRQHYPALMSAKAGQPYTTGSESSGATVMPGFSYIHRVPFPFKNGLQMLLV